MEPGYERRLTSTRLRTTLARLKALLGSPQLSHAWHSHAHRQPNPTRRSNHMFQFCKVCHSNVAASRHSIGGRRWVNLSMVLLLLLLPGIAPAQENFNKTQKSGQQLVVRNENGNKDVQDAVSVDPKYSIGPQDVLSISVWKESDLTQTVVVRPDGRISLPLVNDVQAAGLTPMQLAGS